MTVRVLLAVAFLMTAGCAPLAPTAGTSGSVTWSASDFADAKGKYTFTLILNERAGTTITYDRTEYTVYQANTVPRSGGSRVSRVLPRNGEL